VLIKRLLSLLSAPALIFTASAAEAAATPPPEPEPSTQYVRACDAFGTGYFYIPGTDTCLRMSGFVRSEGQGGDQVYAHRRGDKSRDTYSWLSRATLRFNTASQTDWGVLRSFMELRSDWQAGAQFGSANDDTGGSLRFAYIELGGLRVGLDETIFAQWTGYYGKVMNDDIIDPASTRTNVISYTYDPGNGFSAILGVEQGNSYNGDGIARNSDLDDNDIGVNSADKGGYRYRRDGSWAFRKLSRQTHNYTPYILGGWKFKQGWGGFSNVWAFDSYYSSWATKARFDANLTDKFSAFLMAGYKAMDDYYAVDDTFGKGGKKTRTLADGSTYTTLGIYRQVNSLYGDWGGHWALWLGSSYQLRKQTSINSQLAYSADRTFAASANISHEVVPGLSITPEVTYINWDNRYGSGHGGGQLAQSRVNDVTTSQRGQSAVQGMLRLQRNF